MYQPPNQPWQPYFQPPMQPPRKSRHRLWLILAIIGSVLIATCVLCSVIAVATSVNQSNATPAVTPTHAQVIVTQASTRAPTTIAKPTPCLSQPRQPVQALLFSAPISLPS